MDETFDNELLGTFSDDGAPDEAPDTTGEAPETDAQQTEAGAPDEAPGDEDDLRAILERAKAENPEQAAVIDAIHREFQRGLTPKLQAAAELRKQYEGVAPELASWARQMNELAVSNPAEAAAALMAEAQRLQGQQQAAPVAEEPDFATDYDREVWHEVQELKALKQQILAERNEAIVDRELAKIGKQVGLEIPYEQKDRVVREMVKDGAPASMAGRYWKDLYFDLAIQKARDEAAGVVSKKQGMTVPSTLASRAGTGAMPEPTSWEEAVQQEFRARNLPL